VQLHREHRGTILVAVAVADTLNILVAVLVAWVAVVAVVTTTNPQELQVPQILAVVAEAVAQEVLAVLVVQELS
jgi:hypothetical protein